MVQPTRRAMLEEGRRVPITVTLDPECHALLHALAVADGTSRSAIIDELVRARAKRQRITVTESAVPVLG